MEDSRKQGDKENTQGKGRPVLLSCWFGLKRRLGREQVGSYRPCELDHPMLSPQLHPDLKRDITAMKRIVRCSASIDVRRANREPFKHVTMECHVAGASSSCSSISIEEDFCGPGYESRMTASRRLPSSRAHRAPRWDHVFWKRQPGELCQT